jgi:RES domain-containing protein
MTVLPETFSLRQFDTHRLIPQLYSDEPYAALENIAEGPEHLAAIAELERATDKQAYAENNLLPGIGTAELVFGLPHARIINAAFTHAARLGGRFNAPDRGAWYAGFEIETSQAEIAFHRTVYLAEVGFYHDAVTYVDYLADFSGSFHDLRTDSRFSVCLDPDSYVESQELAQHLLKAGSLGTLFPSVRCAGGTCLACFRPAAVNNVRTGAHYEFAWNGEPEPTVKPVPTR